jgi:hypothetical protein
MPNTTALRAGGRNALAGWSAAIWALAQGMARKSPASRKTIATRVEWIGVTGGWLPIVVVAHDCSDRLPVAVPIRQTACMAMLARTSHTGGDAMTDSMYSDVSAHISPDGDRCAGASCKAFAQHINVHIAHEHRARNISG